jgi:AcrR family transcriptional regulator
VIQLEKGTLNESRRERKKRATRDTIATTARRLFDERGFDAVTVAEIAVAADVAEKTVFNHFATKEDLVFAGREQRLNALVARIAQRPAGMSVLDVFRATTEEMIDGLAAGGDDEVLAVRRIIRGSRTLQERLTMGWEEEAVALATVIAETAGAADDDVIPAVVGRTLVWTHRAIVRVGMTGLPAGEDLEQLAARLRVQAAGAYDRLAAGLEDYGVAGPAGDPAP